MTTYPSSQSLLGIYLEYIQHPESTQYDIPCHIRLSRNIDTAKLKNAIERVIKTYPVFQNRVITQEGELCQYPDCNLQIDQMAEGDVEQRFNEFMGPFDLSKDAMSRFLLIETPESLHLISDIHHLILDGLTYKTLLHLIELAYNEQDLPTEEMSLYEYAKSEQETQELIALGTGEELAYDRTETIVDLFRKQVALYPSSTAVVDEVSSITYAELDKKSDLLARALISKGVVADSFVAIMLPRRKEFLVSVLGVFKAGGAYIPLDSDYPNDRLLYMLEDSAAKVLITTRELFEEKQKEGDFSAENIIFIDEFDFSQPSSAINLAKPENLAYMIYTSGSTGKPKGVMMEHKGLCALLEWLAPMEELKFGDNCAEHSSFSFDASLFDLYPPLATGGTVHILGSSLRQDVEGIYQYFIQHNIIGATFSTQLGMELLNQYDLPLRYMVMGGEKLKATRPSSVKVINGYGPTEFTVCSSYHVVDQSRGYANIPIGRAVPNTTSAIVDAVGNLLPRGVAGELCLIGRQIARGYWNRPELTAEKFVDCPFIEGERMYRTGDLARWNENGELEYLGRIDNQVKLRGFRIELGEIESAISKYSGVQSAVVEVKEIGGTQHLCGYYTSQEAIDEEKLREQLSASLTDYMVPTAFMRLEALPLTPNGKVNRKVLPIPEIKAAEIIAPETALEQSLFEIAAKLLGTESFGVTTNLISMGLTSMGAIKLSLAVQRELELNLQTKDILRTPIIRKWVELIGTEQDELKVYERRDYYPLTENQLGVYIDWEQHRDGLQYNLPMAMKLTGVDPIQMKASLEKVLEAHTYLKTRLGVRDGEVVQLRRDEEPINILFETLNTEPDAAFLQSRVREFNLLEDDLYRIEVYKSPEHTYIFIDIHHIIYDGGSIDVLLSDLQQVYNGIEIPKEQFTAYDYSLYYADWKASEAFNQTEAYFDTLVEGAESIQYPTSTVTEAISGSKEFTQSIPRAAITDLCRKVGVTENCFFTTALMQVIHRITREDNILMTTISNGRSLARMADTMGMFVQTLPVVSRSEKQTISECLTSMQEQLLETISRDKYPFTRLVERHGVKPNILFAYQGEVADDLLHIGEAESIALHLDTAKVPLSLNVSPVGDSYELVFEFDSSMYNEADILQLAQALESFALSVSVADIEQNVSSVSIVSPQDNQELITLGTGEELLYDRTETFVDLFRKQVALYPDSTAVVYEDRSYTYSEIDQLSTRLAIHLRKLGVCREKVVGVMIDRSEWMVIYPLSIMKAGGAYMPLDYNFPTERLSYMVEDAGVSLILSETDRVMSSLPAFNGEVILTSDVLLLPHTDEKLEYRPAPEDMYVVLYTSGSTGQPKGCVLEHHNLLNFCYWYIKDFDVTANDRSIAYANFGFDAHMIDIYPLLMCGGSVCIIPSVMRMDITFVNDYIEEKCITIAFLTTQIGSQIVSMFDNRSLRLLSIGGEQLPPIKKPSYRFYNVYGPTECTLYSSFYGVKCDNDNKYIGRPLANYQLYVLDKEMRLVPRGVAGELCISGEGVARGYLNRPELTAEKFVMIDGKRLYRTGDLVRWAENGNIQYLGRIDSQVKLRGFRIELGEIESVISKYSGIQSAVVEVKEIGGTQHLCGYYTSQEAIDEEKLREQLSASLTDYMVPTAFMRLESLPLTPNGKVNRKALPIPEIKAAEIIAPETALEQSLFEIAAKLLNNNSFGVTTNLISMGLTSMGAIKLSLAVQRELGLSLQTKDILKTPIIRKWTELIDTIQDDLKRYDKRDYYPLTENQLGVYIDWEQHRDGLQYNVPMAMKLTGVDPDQMHASLEKVLEAHPYLKTRLGVREGEIVQLRRDEESINIHFETLSTEPDASFFQSRVREFNLFEDDLYRIEVYQVREHTYLFIDIHHIIYDGGSVSILINDLQNAYNGIEIDKEVFSAYDYSLYYSEWKESEAFSQTETYFDQLVEGAESIQYPTSTVIDAVDVSQSLNISIPRQSITELCRKVGVTENCFFTTAFMQVLHRITREDNILMTTISNGRSSTQMAQAMGMFVQTLPVVSRSEKQSVGEALSEMQQQLLETISRDKYPFTRLVERHGIKPNIMFVYQGEVLDNKLDVGEVENVALHLNTSKVPLSLNVVPVGDSYKLVFEFDSSMYNEADMLQLAQALESFATSISVVDVEQNISSVSIVSGKESQELITLGTGEELAYDRTETFVDLFRKQVALYPDSTAVVDEVSSISYAELDRKSDLLATELISKGVVTDSFVAVMLLRRKEFLVSTLGVFKAGGAYIPLDSEYPNDRLLYMLEDSAAKVLITTRELFNEKQKAGDFSAENIIFVDEFDFSQPSSPINLAKPENLAYMIYTSGSTGKPKGVMVEHRGLRNFTQWLAASVGLQHGNSVAEHVSFSFDASLNDLLSPLTVGATVHILDSSLRQDMEGLYNYFQKNNITGAALSTQLGMAMLNQYDLPLSFMLVGGEKLSQIRPSSVKVINSYGPTEFTVCSSYHIVDQSREYTNIPIGRAVPNTISAVVDVMGNLVPRGVAGELCLIGRQIARGYWNRPELTAEKFVSCPFIAGEKMYRTGDLARWNEDGELEYLGRIDNQVKLRGFRIELGEIESAISKYSGIQSAVVEVKEIGGTQHLCGYYTSNEPIDEEKLREELAESLTEYMVPTAFMRLEALPLTPNGKVNRKALPIPEIKSTTQYIAPANEIEQTIADLIQSVLNLSDPVGREDSFFALGGDSIKSIRLVSLLRQKGITIQVSDIMKLKTVKAIAVAASQNSEITDINQSHWSSEVAYTAIEQFFFDLNLAKPTHFNQSTMLQSTDRVAITALTKSLKTVTTHHDMLRAVYRDGKQYVRKAEGEGEIYSLEVCDLRTDANYNATIEEKANELQQSIDLENGPLFKSILFRLPDYDAILIVIHHLVVDGVSWRIMTEDINIAYAQIIRGNEPKLPAKSNSFKEWAEAIGRYRQSYPLLKEVEYWQSVQQEVRKQPLPKERSVVILGTQRTLTSQTTKKLLGESSKAYNTEVNDLLITALGRSYAIQTNEQSLSINMEGHGREAIHEPILIDRTVGWFTSTYPVVIHIDADDIRKNIRSVKETLHRVPNRGLGYGILQHIGQDNNPLDKDLTPQILFNYLGEFSESNDNSLFTLNNTLPQGSAVASENVFGTAMSINCWVADGELKVIYSYDPAVWSDDKADAFADGFIEELENIVHHTTECQKAEYTASDLGETSWSDDEFTSVYAHYKEKGEEIERIYPLTPMQEGMLFKAMTDTDSAAYHITNRYSLDILPTKEQLEYVLEQLSVKHEVLHTTIISSGVREPRQALLKGRKLGLDFIDISLSDDQDQELQRIEEQEFYKPIDLQEEPLFRLVCIKTGQNKCQLLFVMHHIITDGWCISIYMNDFKEYLSEITTGNIQLHKNHNGRYEQYVREIAAKDPQAGLSYWRELLSGYDTKAVIPSYGTIAPEKRSTESSVMVELDKDIFNTIKQLCSKEEVTVNTVVELAWGLLLQCYNRSQDAVFVKVVSGRNNSKESVEDMVGLFINSIPVRVTTEAKDTLVGLLGRMQRQAAESNEFDYSPLSEVQQQSELGRDLFQSILAFENYSVQEGKDSSELFNLKIESAKEDNISEIGVVAYVGDSLVLGVNFDTSLYYIEEVRCLVSSFTEIITAIATKPNLLVSELSLVGEQQSQELIALGTGEELAYDRTETFIDLFKKQVVLYPDSTAVVDEVSEITYSELDKKSDLLAAELISKDVVTDSFVAVMLPRRKEFLVSILGVFKAGGAYIPLDSEYPNDRLLYMLEDSAAKVLITTRSLFDEKQKEGDFSAENIIFVDEFDFSVSSNAINLAKPEKLAYMIYTSGSTGKPKGVMVEHKNLRSLVEWRGHCLAIKHTDAFAQHASFSFDASLDDLITPLGSGGTVHILSSELRQDTDGLAKYFEQNQIVGITLSTQLGMEMLNQYDLPLRFLMMGGEKLKPTRPSSVKVINGYGPTEFTVCSSYHVVDQSREYANIPIGRAVPNTTSAVVDAMGNLVPRGVAGELCLIGRQIARGYWNRPELTAEKFVDCPFLESEKMYRTGDLARWNEDGELEYLGRIDNQVKLRGFRIELGEIESAISKYTGIQASVVEVKEIGGTQHLCGYYTSAKAIDEEKLREELSASLTDYMVPTAFMRLEALPLTPNGKVNRKALPIPQIKAEDIVLPETGKEQILFEIAKELLHTDCFGVTSDLSRVGLTSLSAIKLVAMANKKGLKLKANDVLKYKTIRNIVSHDMSIFFWINEYTPQKPVLVFIYALTPPSSLPALINRLTDYYSVITFEPLNEHYDYLFTGEDIDEIANMYTSLLDLILPDKAEIFAFAGHCLGGEIAYRAAVKWEEMTGRQAKALLFSLLLYRRDDAEIYTVKEDAIPLTDDQKQIQEGRQKWSTIGNSIINIETYPYYYGNAICFRAILVDEITNRTVNMNIEAFNAKNEQYLRQYMPNIEIIDVTADHYSILDEKHIDLYLQQISGDVSAT